MTSEQEIAALKNLAQGQRDRADRLEKELEAARAGLEEVRRAADALMIQTALACGEETDRPAGKRLVLPWYSVEDTLTRYRLRVRQDGERRAYVLWAEERNS